MQKIEKTYVVPEYKNISCVGDSITAGAFDEEGLGWVGRLSQMLAKTSPPHYIVNNAGISGHTTADTWHNITSHVMHLDPELVILNIGVNDICISEGSVVDNHQLPYLDRLGEWSKIIDFLKKMQWRALIVGPLPVESDIIRISGAHSDIKELTGFRVEQEHIIKYNNDIEFLCQKHGMPFLRLFEVWHARLSERLFVDGLHPNAKGHKLLAEQIYAQLKAMELV